MTTTLVKSTNNAPNNSKQRGVATLVFSLVMLTLITFVALYSSRSVFLEQKIANNDARSKKAFEAAEAGLSEAIKYLSNDPDTDNDGVVDVIYDPDADGDADRMPAGTGWVDITVRDVSTADDDPLTKLEITSVGRSDDGSAMRTIIQTLSSVDPLPNAPENPMTSRGQVVIGGSATITNPEGMSTIWSGSSINLGGNASTSTMVPDVSRADYPLCMDTPRTCTTTALSRAQNLPEVDLLENDTTLDNLTPAQLFENFFGYAPAAYRDSRVTLDIAAATAQEDAHLATDDVIWVEGDVNFNGSTVGCSQAVNGDSCSTENTEPSILILNGNANFAGNMTIYGILFVMGDLAVTGNTTVIGALISAGGTNTGGGSFDIIYDSNVVSSAGGLGNAAAASGTWRDF